MNIALRSEDWQFHMNDQREQRNKLEQMASLETVPCLILSRLWPMNAGSELVEQQGLAYAKTVAEAMNLKLDMDNPADREKLRRAILDLVAGRKMRKQKGPASRARVRVLARIANAG
jgi:hypothetical protein